MSGQPDNTQDEPRIRPEEVANAVPPRRFVLRSEFAAMSRSTADLGLETYRADQDAFIDQEPADPYLR